MTRTLTLVLLLLPCTALAQQLQPLFNGENLQGWQVQGEIEWLVQDRALVASGNGDGFLLTDEAYGDFYLKVEFWVDATTNSGIFIRCKDRQRIHPETCYELNIWDEHPQQEARTGSIVFKHMPPLAHVSTVGRWNTYEVWAKDSALEVKVNGITTCLLYTSPSPRD